VVVVVRWGVGLSERGSPRGRSGSWRGQFDSKAYLWHVDSCREIAAGSWECIVDPDGTVPGVGEVQAVVTDVNGKYIVGPFTDAP
jgi:hypothetical protein